MKLYIPTSSRNFNCLFSEESISPKSFYGERGFGYSKWHSIHENPYENLIVLYDEIKYFERPNEGYDDYPLVIEVNLDNKEIENLFLKDKNSGAYLYDGTLYFNPITTNFIFFDVQQKDIVLSKAEGSLETKLVRIYLNRIQIKTRVGGKYDVPKVEDAELNREKLKKSIRVNKVKGFIYGYHIGNLLSVSKEKGSLIETTQALLNLASAIYGSIDKKPTLQQKHQLQQTLFPKLNIVKCLLNKAPLGVDSVVPFIEDVLNQCHWEPTSNSPDKSVINLYSMILNPKTQEQAINNLTSSLHQILNPANSQIIPEKVKDIFIKPDNSIELPVLESKLKDKDIAELWVNGELADNKYKGSLASYRFNLATELIIAVRDNVYKDDWANSSAKTFLNALRNNLNGEEFSETWSDDVFSAIAAVLMKGDTWDGLRLFLISKGIQNQAMPFAFYGMINGFANLPKDFTNILLNNSENENLKNLLLSAIYESVNGFGMKANKESSPQFNNKSNNLQGEKATEFGAFSAKDNDKFDINERKKSIFPDEDTGQLGVFSHDKTMVMHSLDKKKPSAIKEEKHDEIFQIKDEFLQILEEETPKQKKQEYKETYIPAVCRAFEISNSLAEVMDKIDGITVLVARTAWKNAKKRMWEVIKQREEIFPNTDSVIESLSCTKSFPSFVIKRLNDDWEYTGIKQNIINEHISFFINLIKKEGRGDAKHKELKGYITNTNAEILEKELKEFFEIEG